MTKAAASKAEWEISFPNRLVPLGKLHLGRPSSQNLGPGLSQGQGS